MPEISYTVDVGALLAGFGTRFLAPVLGSLGAVGSRVIDEAKLNFANYFNNQIQRCANVKTLISTETPVPLHQIYVETKLVCGSSPISDKIFLKNINNHNAYIITGTAGTGKSMFMRHLFLSICNERNARLPLFVELRNFSSISHKKLVTYIYHTIVLPGASVTERQFELLLVSGGFFLILDGFDEVDPEYRQEVESQIIELRTRAPATPMVVSSRLDERFAGWSEFHTYKVLPLSKSAAISLIKKLPYDRGVRSKFADAVRTSLYLKHSSFLSIPLLVTMMLITFEQYADIPDKVHIFYEQAFEALFVRHDTSKEAGFQRKRYSNLAINEFKNLLSAMCMVTYMRGKYSFSESEILDFIDLAKKYEKSEVNSTHFLSDLLESVCILHRDGLFITFVHRSFQEYFSAHFISRSPPLSLEEVFGKLLARNSDGVIGMAFDINRDLVEREWILPQLDRLERRIKDLDDKSDKDFVVEILGSLVLRIGDRVYIHLVKDTQWTAFILSLRNLYSDIFRPAFEALKHPSPKDKSLFKKFAKRVAHDGAIATVKLEEVDQEILGGTAVGDHFELMRAAISQCILFVRQSVSTSRHYGNEILLGTSEDL